jgi:hypothetical protein
MISKHIETLVPTMFDENRVGVGCLDGIILAHGINTWPAA